MNRIMLDHCRRWWWVWGLGGLMYIIMTVIISNPGLDRSQDNSNLVPLGVFIGAFLLAVDVQRGHTRALLALPVKFSGIARAWWWVAVGIPAAFLALISVMGVGIAFLIYSQPPVLYPVVINWVDTVLLLGVTFFAFTGLPARGYASPNWKQQARGIMYGIIWGVSIGGWIFFKSLDIQIPVGAGIFGISIILTILGWYRAEALVMEHAGLRPFSVSPARKCPAPSRCAEGGGGLWFMARSMFTRMVCMGLVMFIAVFIILDWLTHSQAGLPARDFLAGNMVALFTFQFMWMMSIQFFVFALHIRHLRVMPVATATLARVLLLVPLAAMVVVYGFSVLLRIVFFQVPLPGLEELVRQGCLLQISSATITIPLLIWRGLDLLNYLIGMAIMMGGIFYTIFFTDKIPMAVNLAVPPIILIGVYFATLMLLNRCSYTYRPRAIQFGGWNWAAGR